MSFRTTYILFGLLVFQILVFALLQKFGPLPGDDLWVLPQLHRAKVKADQVSKIDISRGKEKLVFERDPATNLWKMVKPYPARAEAHLVRQLIDEVVDARREELDLPPDLAEYGLEPPETTVTLTRDSGETATLNVGNTTLDNRITYVTSSERPGVALGVRRSSLDQLFKSAKEFRSPHGLAESSLTIANLKLDDGKHQLALKKTGDTAWEVEQPPFGSADYDGESAPPTAEKKVITGVRELLNTVEGLRVQYQPQAKPPIDDFVAENVSADDLDKKYGLGKTPATLRIDGEVGAGSAFGVKKDDKRVKDALLIGNKADEGDKYYARLESEPNVFRIAAKGVEPLLAIVQDPTPLRNKDLVSGLDDAKVDAIDIQNAGGVIHLRRPQGGAWKLVENGATRIADPQSVQELIGMLTTKRQVKAFPAGPDADLGLDKGQATVSLWQGGIAEDKDKKDDLKLKSEVPDVKLIFGSKDKDGKLVHVRREAGKDVARLSVPEGLLSRVNEGRLAYYNRVLPGVPTGEEVVKLVVVRDGKTFEIAKEDRGPEQPPVWKFIQPPELAGRLADESKVRGVFKDLYQVQAQRFVAEKADAAQLAEFKLAPPELKIVVTTRPVDKDKKETPLKSFEFLYGKTAEGLTYGKLGDQELVFQVVAERLAGLRGELADTRVFNFDPLKVQRLKLTAGKKVLELTRKADLPTEWVVQNEVPDFTLDQNRVRVLLVELARLSADRFLVVKSAAKPEHGLGDAERRLVIEIVLDAAEKKEPLTLVLGKYQDAENGVASQSSTLPGDIFLLADTPWSQIAGDGIDILNRTPKKPEEKKEPAKDDKKEPANDDKKEPAKKESAKDDKKKEPTKKEPAKDSK